MDTYIKSICGILLSVMLCLALGNKGKAFAGMLATIVCVMAVIVAFSYLSAVLDFFETLQTFILVDNDLLHILLKAVGIGIMGEIAGLVCAEGGYSSLARAVQLLTSVTIVWISLPLYSQILGLIEELLKGI